MKSQLRLPFAAVEDRFEWARRYSLLTGHPVGSLWSHPFSAHVQRCCEDGLTPEEARNGDEWVSFELPLRAQASPALLQKLGLAPPSLSRDSLTYSGRRRVLIDLLEGLIGEGRLSAEGAE